ncbi:MAG: hypothetical protein AABX13_02325 [Nanoarchaeota archaeon]
MTSQREFKARIQDFFTFSKQEINWLIVAILITGLIFSFRDWGGEEFDFALGLRNFALVSVIAAVSFFFRLSCQKLYALNEGYKAEFRAWPLGFIISLVFAFVSFGRIPLILIGTMVNAFMVKQRLGEFRYGFSYWHNGIIAYWGILGNLILAGLLSIGLYFSPENYFLGKGLALNLIMAFTSLIPLPQLDGLNIFYASRKLWVAAIIITLFVTILLLSKTATGLIIGWVFGLLYALVYILIGSEK